MQRTALSLTLALAGAAALSAAAADHPLSSAATPPKQTVYLYGDASLEELRTSNPLHYARAAKILAAAPQLCRFDGSGNVVPIADAQDVHCLRGFIKPSLPPKWQLNFRLDDVQYIAIITVKGFNPKLTPAH